MIDAIRQYTAAHNREDENSGKRKKNQKTLKQTTSIPIIGG